MKGWIGCVQRLVYHLRGFVQVQSWENYEKLQSQYQTVQCIHALVMTD